jgi:molybdate transport repressor ModE-like protein
MERPTLRQLEALDTIAREGSFRAAARALGISQVAVSDHIKQLEARLGISLFHRAPGGKASLSDAGEAALSRARLILADCDALVSTMQSFASGAPEKVRIERPARAETPVVRKPAAMPKPEPEPESETALAPEPEPEPVIVLTPPDPVAPLPSSDQPITIGIHPSILTRFQDKLAAFEDAFPNRPVSVDFNCFVADRVALALSAGIISIAYFYALGETRVFPSDYLWSERWALYVGENHRLAERDYVSREDLSNQSLISFAEGNRLRPLVEACMTEAGLGGLPYAVESDDYVLLVERVRDGAGILPLFGAAAGRVGASAGLKRLPYVDPIPAVEVRRVIHPTLVEDDEVQALVATLQ